jgi:tagatose-1,6-bisphosphate aldolase
MLINIGKIRSMERCSSERGTFTCLALDHRQNLRRSINPEAPDSVPDSALTDFKLEVARALGKDATAILLDPQYSAAQAVAKNVIPNDTGLIVALEATGYDGDPEARKSRILPGWSVEKAKRMGADMVKLLIYYHPDSSTAAEIEILTQRVADECDKYDMGLMLEPLSYSLNPEVKRLNSAEKRYVVIETARKLTQLGVDVLKAEFPLNPEEGNQSVWQEACAELSEASKVPWILLSAAVDFEIYLRQVTVACQAGASGIAVGRAVWKEAIDLMAEGRAEFLGTKAHERLMRLSGLCTALAKPWFDFYTVKNPDLPSDWFTHYG